MSEVDLGELRHELRELLADLDAGLNAEELESRLHGLIVVAADVVEALAGGARRRWMLVDAGGGGDGMG